MIRRRSPASAALLSIGFFLLVIGLPLAISGLLPAIVGAAIGAVLTLLGLVADRIFGIDADAGPRDMREGAVEREVWSFVVLLPLFYLAVAAGMIYNGLYVELGVTTGLCVAAFLLVRGLSKARKHPRGRPSARRKIG
jgi:hypothetical protein